ncbi:MAG TPA: DUF3662 and FHA domain-containing protein [Mycobacteriales bacterium]|nr:DUF3662 and FHA domain-containing protein [Mycobacteriales bacterium]
MGVLQAFERRLGGLVEGTFAKVFKGDVHPVEIAGALQRESDDRKSVVGHGRVLVPNEYVVELGDRDFERMAEWAEPLGDELAAMVREHAAEAGYSFVGPVTVRLEHVAEIGTGTFRVRSAVAASDDVASHGAAPLSPAEAGPHGRGFTSRPRVVTKAGGAETAYFLSHPVTVIGRAAECDIRLDDPGVSRRHAELRYADGRVELVDLRSTNGVRVNGSPTGRAVLQDGDRIEAGSTTLTFRQDES